MLRLGFGHQPGEPALEVGHVRVEGGILLVRAVRGLAECLQCLTCFTP